MFIGIIGAIGSFLSAAATAIGGAISTAITSLSSLATSASGFLKVIAGKSATFMKLLKPVPDGPLGPVFGPIINQLAIKAITKCVEFFAKKLGIIEEDDQAAEVGYRMEEAEQHEDWKKRSDFENMEDYNAYLKEMIPDEQINHKKFKENHTHYEALGVSALTEGIGEHVGIELTPELITEIGRACMEYEEVAAIVETFKELGYSTDVISDFLKGNVSKEEGHRIEDALLANMQKYYPDKDEVALHERLGEMRVASRDDMYLADEIYKDELTEEKLKKLAEKYNVE